MDLTYIKRYEGSTMRKYDNGLDNVHLQFPTNSTPLAKYLKTQVGDLPLVSSE